MRITFWGVRGSLPAPLGGGAVRRKLVNALVKASGFALDTPEKAEAFCDDVLTFAERGTFGGDTACVQIDTGGPDDLLCDLGSGARAFSLAAIGRHGPGTPRTYHVLLSHVHWDHIMGFPFFAPAFIPGNRIRIYSCHPKFEQAIRAQNHEPCFPVEFDALAAAIEFITLEPGTHYEIAGAIVTGMAQLHGGESFGYRIEQGGRTVIYSTDAEYKAEDREQLRRTAAFFQAADLVIFDSMYSLAETMSVKADWGHSSNIMGVELCRMAGARRLCLFHHEPVNDDDQVAGILAETVRFEEITRAGMPLEIVAAYQGLTLDI
jgi:phosphoribosyl 1,2-cyclic phosphodiesterase